jgi:Asp-tRNA(Asn)/Glu-tRNA(Gln) amidotransferase A subunit family amidase
MSTTDAERFRLAMLASIGFTSLFNASGHPAMSVPRAVSSRGLPLGVQFAARFGDEATLFRLAGQLEAAQPWTQRRPPVG